jgi:hypothetical protein
MERVEKEVVSGSSKTKLTTGNVLGAMAGSKTSERAVKRAILGNNKRQYKRKRTVWSCKECSGTNDRIRAAQARAEKGDSYDTRGMAHAEISIGQVAVALAIVFIGILIIASITA